MTLSGVVKKVLYHNKENFYTVIIFESEQGGVITATGCLPSISVDQYLILHGEFVEHPKYGFQFSIEKFEIENVLSIEQIFAFLSSGKIKGIGVATASEIINAFGIDSLRVIEEEPHRLLEIKGIGQAKLESIVLSYREHFGLTKYLAFFLGLGISGDLAMKLHSELGENAIEIIKENPYYLVDHVFGIGFKRADEIATKLGFNKESEYRVEAAIKHFLQNEEKQGHCFSYEEQIVDGVLELLGSEVFSDEDIKSCIFNMFVEDKLSYRLGFDKLPIYLPVMQRIEQRVFEKLKGLLTFQNQLDYPLSTKERFIRNAQDEIGIKFAPEQLVALEQAFSENVFIITGGPGTGKTTILGALLRIYDQMGLSCMLCTPTGRAAKRLSEATHREAKTIHRLLEYKSYGIFGRDENLPLECDVLIVDEASMIDIYLMHFLLRAVRLGTRLVIVGDADQLPSVGAGNVLCDLIASGKIKTTFLKNIFRQERESIIPQNAQLINNGELPLLNVKDKDFFFIEREDVLDEIVGIVVDRLPKTYGFDPIEDIQVLGFSYKHKSGVDRINDALRERLNPTSEDKLEVKLSGRVFREGDKVMQTANNYLLEWESIDGREGSGIFNGDIGVIESIRKNDSLLVILFDQEKVVYYPFTNSADLTHAYAITVHKSQGSEMPVVVMPMVYTHNMMYRKLLYTGITRAKKMVVLVGSKNILEKMVRSTMELQRRTKLAYLLSEGITEGGVLELDSSPSVS